MAIGRKTVEKRTRPGVQLRLIYTTIATTLGDVLDAASQLKAKNNQCVSVKRNRGIEDHLLPEGE